MNVISLRKRKRLNITYWAARILQEHDELEINALIRLIEPHLPYRLTSHKLAQYLKHHPEIERVGCFHHTNRISVYRWKPSKVEAVSGGA